jgi:hypothetical protein
MESDLRILCVNDVYKPERFSVLKTLTGLHQGSGVTKLGIDLDVHCCKCAILYILLEGINP